MAVSLFLGRLSASIPIPPKQQQAQLEVDAGLAVKVPRAAVHVHDGRAVCKVEVTKRFENERWVCLHWCCYDLQIPKYTLK